MPPPLALSRARAVATVLARPVVVVSVYPASVKKRVETRHRAVCTRCGLDATTRFPIPGATSLCCCAPVRWEKVLANGQGELFAFGAAILDPGGDPA